MAGSLPGLALTQRVDGDGNPLVGGKLYIYEALTTTPVTVYKDFNLTTGQEHPFPMELDAFGQIPNFYLPDGSYRARLTDSTGGTVLFDILQVQAIGEAGGEGTPPTVDQTSVFTTGMIDWDAVDETRTGWVRLNGRTIGNASSGATERANDDTQTLYERNWGKYSNSICPVTGGRGVSAAADFAAGKPMALLDLRFRMPIGLDTMGNSAASRATGVPTTTGDAATAPSTLGESTHSLATGELPSHTHTGTTASGGSHTHGFSAINPAFGFSGSGLQAEEGAGLPNIFLGNGSFTTDASGAHTHTFTSDPTGSGAAHPNVQPTILVTVYIKL